MESNDSHSVSSDSAKPRNGQVPQYPVVAAVLLFKCFWPDLCILPNTILKSPDEGFVAVPHHLPAI